MTETFKCSVCRKEYPASDINSPDPLLKGINTAVCPQCYKLVLLARIYCGWTPSVHTASEEEIKKFRSSIMSDHQRISIILKTYGIKSAEDITIEQIEELTKENNIRRDET